MLHPNFFSQQEMNALLHFFRCLHAWQRDFFRVNVMSFTRADAVPRSEAFLNLLAVIFEAC
ncbi:MAG: hypothetical protein JWM56_177 [Candidatus Peribacteria bacterium]|nr:hypothetical protein [Candidatus Peribacteria bacterium]